MATLAKLTTIPVEEVALVGPEFATGYRKAGVKTVADLISYFPFRHIDRSRFESVAMLPIGEEVTFYGEIRKAASKRIKSGKSLYEVVVDDPTGHLTVTFFNQPFRANQLKVGTKVVMSGKLSRYRGVRRLTNPQVHLVDQQGEALQTGRMVAIYPRIGAVSNGYILRHLHNALKRSLPMSDPIPVEHRNSLELIDRGDAYFQIHFPQDPEQAVAARRRLKFDELYRLELALALRKRQLIENATGRSHPVGSELVNRLLRGLPFQLTQSQEKVLAAIRKDLAAPHPMHRLLQGEVGSGKTVVAVAAMLEAIAGEAQAAVMAPTEVLAIQHFLGIRQFLVSAGLSPASEADALLGMESLFAAPSSDLPVKIALLTSSQVRTNYDPAPTRAATLAAIAAGQVDLVIGTHALIQDGVHFADLGLAVVDEQHRFGVGQRVLLKEKASGIDPDLLVMTATPIPRTLAMTLYGDLDVSVMAEMPPGRWPVNTVALSPSQQSQAWAQVSAEVGEGFQAIVVCPLVEESAKLELTSATDEYERLRAVFPGMRVGLIHGQLPPAEKDAVMGEFRRGDIDLLVATTVIEVGIDVPNATVMVIEDADRFGLSQLHQLRGRVGRGKYQGTCFLIADATTPEGKARIAAMADTTDGFQLAEIDLDLRGQGTVFGARQAGMVDLKLANIIRDAGLLEQARDFAFELVDNDPELESHPELKEEVIAVLGDRVEWLFKS